MTLYFDSLRIGAYSKEMKKLLCFVGGIFSFGIGAFLIRNVFFSGPGMPDIDLVALFIAEFFLLFIGIGLLLVAFQSNKE